MFGLLVWGFGVLKWGSLGVLLFGMMSSLLAQVVAHPRVMLLGFDSGAVMSQFGQVGTAPGQLSPCCEGIRFTVDGSHLVVDEKEAKRCHCSLSVGCL